MSAEEQWKFLKNFNDELAYTYYYKTDLPHRKARLANQHGQLFK
jgi:hypothetical protein